MSKSQQQIINSEITTDLNICATGFDEILEH